MHPSRISIYTSDNIYESPKRKPFDQRLNHRSRCLSTPDRKPKAVLPSSSHVLQAPRKSQGSSLVKDSHGMDEFHIQGALFDQSSLMIEKKNWAFNKSDKPFPILSSKLPQAKLSIDSPDCLSKFHPKSVPMEAFSSHSSVREPSPGSISTPVKAMKTKSSLSSGKIKLQSLVSKDFRNAGLASPDSVSEWISPMEGDKENERNATVDGNNASPETFNVKAEHSFVSPRGRVKRAVSLSTFEVSTLTHRRPDYAKPTHLQNNPRHRRRQSADPDLFTRTTLIKLDSTHTPTRLDRSHCVVEGISDPPVLQNFENLPSELSHDPPTRRLQSEVSSEEDESPCDRKQNPTKRRSNKNFAAKLRGSKQRKIDNAAGYS